MQPGAGELDRVLLRAVRADACHRATASDAIYLIRDITTRLLAPGGTFFFTNIARGNPYRPLIEYFGDWKLIERTEEEIVDYCVRAGVTREAIQVTREATGLTWIIEVTTDTLI